MPLQYFEEINSTNDYIRENLKEFRDNFSGVYTFNQTKGRGLRGNEWISEPGKNIALTFCLIDHSIIHTNLSFWVALMVRDFIENTTLVSTLIKWPNDILVHKKKVCGIMIEKFGSVYVIGIGINVLQKNFDSLSKASSLSLLSPQEYSLTDLVENLMLYFHENIYLLNEPALLLEKYNSHLFERNIVRTFKINDLKINGIIQKVDENGLLWVELEDQGIKKFRIKEIEFLY